MAKGAHGGVSGILTPLWKAREWMVPKPGLMLQTYCDRLTQFNGVGGFYAGQIIADLKYVEPLRSALDWMSFVIPGPGSRAGLNVVYGRPPKPLMSEAAFMSMFARLEAAIRPELQRIGLGDLHAQDLQNCLCEFSKYVRGLEGGKLKRRFVPTTTFAPSTMSEAAE